MTGDLEKRLRGLGVKGPSESLDRRVSETLRVAPPGRLASSWRLPAAVAASLIAGAVIGFLAGRGTAEPEVRTRTVVHVPVVSVSERTGNPFDVPVQSEPQTLQPLSVTVRTAPRNS